MRWQTVVRLVIAAAGLAVAGLVYVQLQDRPADETSGTAPLSDPSVVSSSDDGTRLVLSAEGTPTITIDYKTQRVLADGRIEFTGVSAVFERNGVRRTIAADTAVSRGKAGPTGEQPAQVEFTGNVSLASEDGIRVEVEDTATFYNDDQKTLIPGRMRFVRDRLSGSGVGAELFMDRSVLWINSEARLRVAPATAGGLPVEAQARRIGLADADHFMVLEGDAVMTQQAQRLSADNARVMFTPAGYGVQFIELRGQSVVRSLDAGSTRPNLKAGDINLAFADSGSGLLKSATLAQAASVETRGAGGAMSSVTGSVIELFLGPDGTALTRMQASAPVVATLPANGPQPARVICAQGLQADGDDTRGLTRAYFSGGVEYREGAAGTCGRATSARVATAETLTLGLKGGLNDVESALFQRNFRVVDGDLTATAVDGRYDSAAETLELRSPAGGKRPAVVSAEMDVVASEIDANLKTDAFDARGEGQARVESTLKPSTPKTGEARTGLFERGKVMTGTSERLQYSRDAGTAVYEGAVFLVQGDSRLGADRVALDDAKGDLTATGNVRSRLVLMTPSGTPDPAAKPTEVAADVLVYTDSARTAVYSGSAVLSSASGERTVADRITLTLHPTDRSLQSAEAVAPDGGEVRVYLPAGRQAAGRTVIYDAPTDRYLVKGAPAVFIVPTGEPARGECTVFSGTDLSFSRTSGRANVGTEGGALGTTRTAKCAEVIKK